MGASPIRTRLAAPTAPAAAWALVPGIAFAAACALAGCGAPSEPAARSASGTGDTRSAEGAEVTSTEAREEADVASGAATPSAIQQGPFVGGTREGLPVEPIEPVHVDAEEVRVHFGKLRLEPNATFRPPVSPCQDVLLYVREGTLSAVGTGIAGEDAPATLYAGDAVRFGPEGDGQVTNVGAEPARTIVAFTRAAGSGSAGPGGTDLATRLGHPPSTEACRQAEAAGDPRVQPQRMASSRSVDTLVVAGGKLRVRILLDAEGQGAHHGGLALLDGDPDATVPEHRHPDSAETLFIEDGDGTMRLGDRRVRIEPGVVVYVPPGVLHDFRGAGTRPLRAIQVYAPSGPEQRFRRMAEEARQAQQAARGPEQ